MLSNPYSYVYKTSKKNAGQRGIKFELAKEDFFRLVERSKGCCELSGIPFDFSKTAESFRRPFAPSLDRKVNSRGYNYNNCRLLCVAMNISLNDWGLEPVMRIAQALTDGKPSKIESLNKEILALTYDLELKKQEIDLAQKALAAQAKEFDARLAQYVDQIQRIGGQEIAFSQVRPNNTGSIYWDKKENRWICELRKNGKRIKRRCKTYAEALVVIDGLVEASK